MGVFIILVRALFRHELEVDSLLYAYIIFVIGIADGGLLMIFEYGM